MKMTLCNTAILAALSTTSVANAQGAGDWYVSVFAGYSNIDSIVTNYNGGTEVDHAFDDNGIFGLAVGRSIQPGLRAEVELSYAQYEGGDVLYNGGLYGPGEGEVATTFLMGNIWYDVPAASFGGGVPYVGGGIGAVNLTSDTNFNGNDFGYGSSVTGLAYQVGAGVQFPVGTGMIDVSYRLKAASDLDIDDNDGNGVYEGGDLLSNNLQVGYVFSF